MKIKTNKKEIEIGFKSIFNKKTAKDFDSNIDDNSIKRTLHASSKNILISTKNKISISKDSLRPFSQQILEPTGPEDIDKTIKNLILLSSKLKDSMHKKNDNSKLDLFKNNIKLTMFDGIVEPVEEQHEDENRVNMKDIIKSKKLEADQNKPSESGIELFYIDRKNRRQKRLVRNPELIKQKISKDSIPNKYSLDDEQTAILVNIHYCIMFYLCHHSLFIN